jgi:hypothetical protein
VNSRWILSAPDPNSTADPPGQWVLEDHAQRGGRVLAGENASGTRDLMLEQSGVATEGWKTQISLSRIVLAPRRKYRAAVWMKAESPTLVWINLSSGTAPPNLCKVSQMVPVTTVWSAFEIVFQANPACDVGNSRIALEAGKIVGRLWVARVSLTESE